MSVASNDGSALAVHLVTHLCWMLKLDDPLLRSVLGGNAADVVKKDGNRIKGGGGRILVESTKDCHGQRMGGRLCHCIKRLADIAP